MDSGCVWTQRERGFRSHSCGRGTERAPMAYPVSHGDIYSFFCSVIGLITYLFNKHSLSTYYAPGLWAKPGDVAFKAADVVSEPVGVEKLDPEGLPVQNWRPEAAKHLSGSTMLDFCGKRSGTLPVPFLLSPQQRHVTVPAAPNRSAGGGGDLVWRPPLVPPCLHPVTSPELGVSRRAQL